MHKNLALKNSFVFALAAVICFVVLTTGVSAVHDSIVTITPNIANCDQVGNTFTVNVKNSGTSLDDIFEVRIYDETYAETYGILEFHCGPAPSGWTLFDYAGGDPSKPHFGYCDYITQQFGSYIIEPGEDLNFTFNAVMYMQNCYSKFLVSTLDNVLPIGECEYHTPQVDIDCTPPLIQKNVGDPKIPGTPTVFDYWVTSLTDLNLTASDNTNQCDKGLDYCRWRVTLDDVEGPWTVVENGPTLNWIIKLQGDSNHYLEVECYDVAKNKAILTETDKVDNIPPVTTKVISEPKKIENGVEWVDTVTTITLNAVDPDPTGYSCNIGVDKTWYMNVIDLTENACWNPTQYCKPVTAIPSPYDCADGCVDRCQESCNQYPRDTTAWYDCVETCAYSGCQVDPLWKLYRGVPISKPEESCHILQFFSIDHLGNIEDANPEEGIQPNVNCFFVDKTPPTPSKEIGDPTYGGCPKDIAPESCNGWACLSGLTKDFFVTGRYGNQVNLAQTWELAIWENTTSGEFVRADDGSDPNSYDWESGVEIDFSLSYNHADGKVTYTVGGKTLEWNYQTDKAFNYIIPFAKGDTNGNSVDLTEMELNGMALPDVNSGTGYKGLKVFLSDQDQLNGFTITGKAKLTWSKSPANEKPAFHIFAMNTHDPEDCWVRDDKTGTPGTPITLSCTDQQPHPSGDEEVCYKVSLDDNDASAQYCSEGLETITQQGYEGDWCCVPSPKVIKFVEDSNHDLQYFCRDAVDKKSAIDTEWFRVDSQPPIITKTMIGNYLGDCPPENQSDVCYVADNGQSGVHIAVQDGGEICAVDQTQCGYNLWWYTDETTCRANQYDWDGSKCLVEGGFFNGEDGKDILFTEDSTHDLYLSCHDALGNTVNDVETFLVDSTPPVTTKTYGDPTVVNGNYRWITSATPITLTATDAKVGVDEVIYRVTPLFNPDETCEEACNFKGSGGWNEIEDDHITFTIPQDSCHLIEFYSVDKLGNTELIKRQCVFVDNKEPVTTKTIGQPQVVKTEGTYISTQTSITLSCADAQPHPVDQISIKYRYRYAQYCEDLDEATWSDWLAYDDPIQFTEDSCHELEYYCTDSLGNTEDVQSEIDIVDTQPPVITTTIDGPSYVIGENTYIDGVTKIHVEATDPQPHPVDDVKCEWYYILDGEKKIFGGDDQAPPFDINFPEETKHELHVKCWDALKNKAEKVEVYYVDKTPPVTTKSFSGPQYPADSELSIVLGTAGNFAILSKAGITDVPTSVVTGNVGTSPITGAAIGVSCTEVTGTIYDWNAAYTGGFDGNNTCLVTNAALLTTAVSDMEAAYTDLAGRATTHPDDLYGGNLGGKTLTPGVYKWTTGVTIPTDVTLSGGANDVWIFQIAGTLDISSAKKVILDGAQARNIFWVVAGQTTLGTTSVFNGNILDKTGIAIQTGATLTGRALAQTDVTLDHNTVSTPGVAAAVPHWISSGTSVTLSVYDAGPHKSGIDETKYRITLMESDAPCLDNSVCQEQTGKGEFLIYDGTFKIDEESCHLIEYYSVDNVDKTETVKKQCVFVDNSAPTPDKDVGEPKSLWNPTSYGPDCEDGEECTYFYPEIVGNCNPVEVGQGIDCYKVTMKTPITLDCNDPVPHPVDHEQVCFKVDLDGVDATANYCPNTEYMEDNGYCCVTGPYKFSFTEETEHNLKFYCIDALGNKNSIIDEEKFKVEGAPFEIPLQKKWNLISVPFVLLNDAPDEVFKDTTGVESVWAYDSENNEWLVYTPNGAPDTLTRIEPGWGYWVMEKNEEKDWEQGWAAEWLTIGGSLMSPKTVPPSRELVKGWNLIGFYGTRWQLYPWSDANFQCGDAFNFPDKFIYGDKLYCSLNSLVDTQQGFPKWSSVWSFLNCGEHQTFWLPLNTCPEDDNYQECMSRLYAGRGYWIELDEDDLYAPATTCIWNSDWDCVSNFGGMVA